MIGTEQRTGLRLVDGRREGVSLVEVLVAMVLMSAVLVPVAGMTALGANLSTRGAGSTYRQGVLEQHANRLATLPYASLPGAAGCATVTTGTFPHTRCVTVTDVSPTVRRVTIVVTPSMAGLRPDTAVVDRANPPTGNPLNMP